VIGRLIRLVLGIGAIAGLLLQFPVVQNYLIQTGWSLYRSRLPDFFQDKTLHVQCQSCGFFPFQIGFETLKIQGVRETVQANQVQFFWNPISLAVHRNAGIQFFIHSLEGQFLPHSSLFFKEVPSWKFSSLQGEFLDWDHWSGKACLITPQNLQVQASTHHLSVQGILKSEEGKVDVNLQSPIDWASLNVKSVWIHRLQGEWKKASFELKSPIQIFSQKKIAPFAITIANIPIIISNLWIPVAFQSGKIQTQGVWKGILQSQSSMHEFLRRFFGVWTPEWLQVSAQLSGGNLIPQIQLDCKSKFPLLKSSSLDCQGQIDLDWTSSRFGIHQFRGDLPTFMNLDFDVTGRFFLTPPYFEITKSSGKGWINLQILEAILDHDGQIQGIFRFNVHSHGILDQLCWGGEMTLEDGFYENVETGTLVQNIHLRAQGNQDRFQIQKLQGFDRSSKKRLVQGEGYLQLKKIVDPLMDLKLIFEKFEIASTSFFSAKSTGYLTLTGPFSDLQIGGNVTLDKARLLLEEVGDSEIPKIKVITMGTPPKLPRVKVKKELAIPLSIQTRILHKFYIQGLGMVSEWKGDLTVLGSLSHPYLQGKLNSIRGKLDLFGRQFQLRRGRIFYDETHKKKPLLDLTTYRSLDSGDEVFFLVQGVSPTVQCQIQTYPMQPLSDRVSLLLFGKKSSEISLLQGAKLATALSAFQGGRLAGLDVFEQIRNLFNLQHIEFKEYQQTQETGATETHPAICLSRDFGSVTVSANQGTTSNSTSLEIRVPMTKNIVLSGTVGGKDSGGGVSYQRRY
jgi:hypothetical protein